MVQSETGGGIIFVGKNKTSDAVRLSLIVPFIRPHYATPVSLFGTNREIVKHLLSVFRSVVFDVLNTLF